MLIPRVRTVFILSYNFHASFTDVYAWKILYVIYTVTWQFIPTTGPITFHIQVQKIKSLFALDLIYCKNLKTISFVVISQNRHFNRHLKRHFVFLPHNGWKYFNASFARLSSTNIGALRTTSQFVRSVDILHGIAERSFTVRSEGGNVRSGTVLSKSVKGFAGRKEFLGRLSVSLAAKGLKKSCQRARLISIYHSGCALTRADSARQERTD